jgi:hypothetical protein
VGGHSEDARTNHDDAPPPATTRDSNSPTATQAPPRSASHQDNAPYATTGRRPGLAGPPDARLHRTALQICSKIVAIRDAVDPNARPASRAEVSAALKVMRR